MPVTARLSKLFYERLGEQVANELVDWFNAVDATYRADLQALNEQNFARFDAKLEQRIAELRADLRSEIAGLRGEMKGDTQTLRGDMKAETQTLRGEMQALKAELIKWMFLFWATTMAGLLYR